MNLKLSSTHHYSPRYAMKQKFIFALTLLLFTATIASANECAVGDCKNGFGILSLENGTSYIGAWKDGKYHGHGTLFSPQGSGKLMGTIYEGEFADGLFQGNGRLTYPDGRIQEGRFNRSRFMEEQASSGSKDTDIANNKLPAPEPISQAMTFAPPTPPPVPTYTPPTPAYTPPMPVTPTAPTTPIAAYREPAQSPVAPSMPAVSSLPMTPVMPAAPTPVKTISRTGTKAKAAQPATPAIQVATPMPPPQPGTPFQATSGGTQGKYPEGSTRLLTDADLQGKSSQELGFMRNEIFARHSYIFRSKTMANHFGKQSWYQPLYDDVSARLSPIEKANISFIKRHE